MKRAITVIGCFLFLNCVGCVTVKIPKYLKSENPYRKEFFASYKDTLDATKKTLDVLGWEITDTVHPSLFEQGADFDEKENRQVLIFTEARQTPLFLSSRYITLNVYVWPLDNSTNVEIRSFSVTPVLFNNIESYKNDSIVNKIFNQIEKELEN